MPSNAADMYLVMLEVWRSLPEAECGCDDCTYALDVFSDYLDRLWWSLDTAELIRVTEVMQADANRLRARQRV